MKTAKFTYSILLYIIILSCSSNSALAFDLEVDNDTLILDNNSLVEIHGQVVTQMGTPILGAEVNLLGAEIDQKRTTGTDGNYSFADMSPEGAYTMVADIHRAFNEELDIADLILLEQLIDANADLSEYNSLVADVNGSGEVTQLDAQILKSIILGKIDNYTNNSSWKFIVEGEEENILSADNFLQSSKEVYSYDIIGFKVGDLDGSINSILEPELDKTKEYISLTTSDKHFVIGEEVHVEISPREDATINGIQFSLSYDTDILHFNGVNALEMDIEEDDFTVKISDSGIVTIIYYNQDDTSYDALVPLFELLFISNKSGNIKQALRLSNEQLTSKVYDSDLNPSLIEWRIDESEKQEIEFQNNAPNPFTNFTTIDFSLPEEMEVVIEISNAAGSIIHSISNSYAQGENFIELGDELGSHYGMLFVTIETAEFSEVKRMMRIR